MLPARRLLAAWAAVVIVLLLLAGAVPAADIDLADAAAYEGRVVRAVGTVHDVEEGGGRHWFVLADRAHGVRASSTQGVDEGQRLVVEGRLARHGGELVLWAERIVPADAWTP